MQTWHSINFCQVSFYWSTESHLKFSCQILFKTIVIKYSRMKLLCILPVLCGLSNSAIMRSQKKKSNYSNISQPPNSVKLPRLVIWNFASFNVVKFQKVECVGKNNKVSNSQ